LQDELPVLYRGHDAFLFTSRYEAWGMPVLEAMASGVPVVATHCMGVDSFAKPGVNALLADPQASLT
jgi:glycosyltransferase involved in cell wall biosynthesis